ncbi:MAG: DNA repair protein RecO [Bacteroidetes bacterium HGW-Bacteroidetes-4]|jgi:DNA repair protein RecO (recombination protein O)|nr:MAG: DNA repair protein RecO [Bacteroidetes bacterium HGW-Bacteroidetes-4]
MLSKTEAIVLNYTKYSDTSIIVHVLSEKYGRQSLLVYGIGNGKQNKLGAFQPLFLLDTQIYYKASASIQKLKEYKLVLPLHSLTQEITKSALALFISEVIHRTVREEFADERLYAFVKTAILVLEETNHGLAYFHLVFLTKIARYMGFMPDELIDAPYYDFKEGHGVYFKPSHAFYVNKAVLEWLICFLNAPFTEMEHFSLNKSLRNELLEALVQLFELHLLNFNALKSFAVLKDVFSD